MRLPHVHPADGLLLTLLAYPLRYAMRACDTFVGLSYLKRPTPTPWSRR